jgi:hypothetical protein
MYGNSLAGSGTAFSDAGKMATGVPTKFWLLIGVSAALGVGTAACLFDFSERPISKRPLPG